MNHQQVCNPNFLMIPHLPATINYDVNVYLPVTKLNVFSSFILKTVTWTNLTCTFDKLKVVQRNPVNMPLLGPKKLALLTRVFLQENIWRFLPGSQKKVAVRRVSTVVFWVSGFHNWSINSWRLEILLQDQDVTNAVTGSFFSVKLSIPRNFVALLIHAWKHWVLTCWLKWCFLENSSPAADFLAQG